MKDDIKDSFLDPKKFELLLEQLVLHKNLSHTEAILELCKIKNIEYETVPGLLTSAVKKQVKIEATTLKMIRVTKRRKKNG